MKTQLPQLNEAFGSFAKLKAASEYLKREIASGRPVWIGQAGYGFSRYAVFNVPRWNAAAGDYICKCELNGELPRNWAKFLPTLASYNPQSFAE